MIERPSANFDRRPPDTPIDMLVLHYTGMPTGQAAAARLCDPKARVSAHYLIDEDGTAYRLVPEDRRAWHAGAAFWRGETDINGRSVGIELVNPGHAFGYRPFPAAQMAALETIAREILARHPIPARNVVGHSDLAPRRKTDPGELFDWARLAGAGIGLWPEEDGEGGDVAAMLAEFGYETVDLKKTVEAFQRRFRPARIDGVADDETAGRLQSVLRMAGALASP